MPGEGGTLDEMVGGFTFALGEKAPPSYRVHGNAEAWRASRADENDDRLFISHAI